MRKVRKADNKYLPEKKEGNKKGRGGELDEGRGGKGRGRGRGRERREREWKREGEGR